MTDNKKRADYLLNFPIELSQKLPKTALKKLEDKVRIFSEDVDLIATEEKLNIEQADVFFSAAAQHVAWDFVHANLCNFAYEPGSIMDMDNIAGDSNQYVSYLITDLSINIQKNIERFSKNFQSIDWVKTVLKHRLENVNEYLGPTPPFEITEEMRDHLLDQKKQIEHTVQRYNEIQAGNTQ